MFVKGSGCAGFLRKFDVLPLPKKLADSQLDEREFTTARCVFHVNTTINAYVFSSGKDRESSKRTTCPQSAVLKANRMFQLIPNCLFCSNTCLSPKLAGFIGVGSSNFPREAFFLNVCTDFADYWGCAWTFGKGVEPGQTVSPPRVRRIPFGNDQPASVSVNDLCQRLSATFSALFL